VAAHLLDSVRDGLAGVAGADPRLLALAALALVAALVCDVRAWQTGLAAQRRRLAFRDAAARYAVGSLANALAPARVGTVVRLGLFARRAGAAPTAATATAVGAARLAALAGLALVGLGPSVLPVPPQALAGAAAVGAVLAYALRRRLGCLRLAGWVAASTACRVGAAAAAAWALGVGSPLLAASTMLAALGLAGTLPVTPGNTGVGAAAVAFALAGHGVAAETGLAAGLAFGLVETSVSIATGAAGGVALLVARRGSASLELPAPAHALEPAPARARSTRG